MTVSVAALPAAGTFRPYGPSHWAVLTLFAVGAIGLVIEGRRHRGRLGGLWFGRGFGWLILAVQLPLQLSVLLPPNWNVNYSLPLQLCDLAWITAVIALWTRRRWACALTYYWGLTLTSQAFLTPELNAPDFPSREYVMFWAMHCFIVWAAIYLTWGLGIRPSWVGYRTAIAVTGGWVVVLLGFNSLTGANYGFLNRKPPSASLLDVLGPWPWYLGVEFVLAGGIWALITWPWVRTAVHRAAGPGRRQPKAV